MTPPTSPGPKPKPSSSPPGSTYHRHLFTLYINKLTSGPPRLVTTDPTTLESLAEQHMAPEPYGYIRGSAGAELTTAHNRAAFARVRLIPRMMRATLPRDLGVTLFGRRYASPVLMAPVGVQGAYHEHGERGTAAACAELGVPFVVSTASSAGLESVAAEADRAFAAAREAAVAESSESSEDGNADGEGDVVPEFLRPEAGATPPRWFQLYWPTSDDLTASLLRRAKAAGCSVLVVTLDTFTMAWRPRDLDHGYLPFATGQGCALGFEDPVFRAQFAAAHDGDSVEENAIVAARAWLDETFSGRAHTWEDLVKLREMWGEGPIVLKGILSVGDAVRAMRAGMDGIVVSNHGGRQLDGAVASLEVLPEIVDAVGESMTVLFDSGIRTGTDVMKALALGAKAVMVGRPVMYGLGIAGRDGAREVLAGLLADLDQSMGLAGVKNVGELDRGMLRVEGALKAML